MPKLSKEAKQRLQHLFKGGQFAIRWGFIPVVLYLGFKRGADPGMPEPTLLRLDYRIAGKVQGDCTTTPPPRIDGNLLWG